MDELVVQVKRVTDALERIAGIRSKTPEDDLISWLASRGKEIETVERIDKKKEKVFYGCIFCWYWSFVILFFLNIIFFCFLSMGKKWMWVITIEEARIQVFDYRKGKLWRNTYAWILQQRLLLKYKYQIATKTMEQNTSKQISVKEAALRSVYKYSLLLLFLSLLLFFFETDWMQRNRVKKVKYRYSGS